ncbi:MAG TPA: hypothetical protein VH120_07050 [Gemmataceae bacterium]|jgi:hypothetical protein|nr:hypothetical protein [Gemmataceae bacterium]
MRRLVRAGLLVVTGVFGLALLDVDSSPGQQIKAPAMVAPAIPVDEDAMVRQVEQQYGVQFRQLTKSELHFMRVVTGVTREQYEKIATDADPAMKVAIRNFAQAMRGGIARGDQNDPRMPITEAIAKSVKATLSPEQANRYQKELDERRAARKRLVVANLVAMIDRVVILRPDQREKLGEVLAENWDNSWDQLQLLMYGGQYFPAMPDAKIRPILSEAQQTVWRGIPKGNVHFGVNFGFVQGIEFDDELWDGEAPKKDADKGEEKKEPRPDEKGGKRR